MQEKPTKSREISERLRQEILGGKFDTARKLPSEHQLMRRFSVARETVRAALKELIDKKLVERRHGYGTFLADLAKTKAAQKFAMIVPDAYYPFYQRICRGISDAAKARGLQITISCRARCSFPRNWSRANPLRCAGNDDVFPRK